MGGKTTKCRYVSGGDMHNLHRSYAYVLYPNHKNSAIRSVTPKTQEQ
ncbi:hypothetical protein ACSSVY_003040 [Roseovarius sp. MBR-51]